MEKYLKEIAKELRLIRIELQRENELYEMPQIEMDEEEVKPTITERLNEMFNDGT